MAPITPSRTRSGLMYSPYALAGAATRTMVPYAGRALAAYAPAASAVYNVTARAYRAYRARRNGSRPQISSGVVTTEQRDYKTQYRKKRGNRRGRRKWIRFKRRVYDVMDKVLGSRTVLRNGNFQVNTASGLQNYACVHLYGIKGVDQGGEVGCNDIEYIFSKDVLLNTGADKSHKVRFTSAVMDLTLRNPSETIDLEVDLYDIVYGDETKENSFLGMINQGNNNTQATNGTGNKIALTSRGAQLFDMPEMVSYGKVRILKKMKIFLPKGNIATYQVRDPKNRLFAGNDYSDTDGYVRPGATRSIFMIVKTIVGQETGTGSILIGWTRKYAYKIIENNDNTSGYNMP